MRKCYGICDLLSSPVTHIAMIGTNRIIFVIAEKDKLIRRLRNLRNDFAHSIKKRRKDKIL